MATPPDDRLVVDELAVKVQRWVRAGVISREQGDEILRLEAPSAAVGAPEGRLPVRRLTPVAELVSYLGIVLVLISGGLAVNRLWHDLGVGGRVGVGVVLALLGLIGGAALARLDEEGAQRLSWFSWLCGTGGVAMTVAVLVDSASSHNHGWTQLSAGLAVSAVSVALWRNRERPLQFLSAAAGLAVSVAGVVTTANWHPSTTGVGLAVWGAGVALALLGVRVVRPGLAATLVAQGALFMGAMVVTTSSRVLGIVLGTVAAAAGVGEGLRSRRPAVMVVGVASFFIFLVRLFSYYLQGPGALLAAFAAGVGLVGVVIWRATRKRLPPVG